MRRTLTACAAARFPWCVVMSEARTGAEVLAYLSDIDTILAVVLSKDFDALEKENARAVNHCPDSPSN